MSHAKFSRRGFLAASATAPLALAASFKKVPIGLELYSVRNEMKADLFGTVKAVAKQGYEGVEFYSPYFEWTPEYTKEVRKLLDDVGMKCFSTHNSAAALAAENVAKAIELNKILGSRFVVMASAGKIANLDGWKGIAERLNQAAEKMKPAGLLPGFHNHQTEFRPLDGTRPMELLAKETGRDVVLQLDVGTCVEAGVDPVEWINKNPGRIKSMHCKEWSSDATVGYKALFGEGNAPWKKIFEAAENTGGIEHYLIEQEGSRFPPLETSQKCLELFRTMRA